MYIVSIISLSAGVGIFMFGMLLMKYSLEESFREKVKAFLCRFTKNRFSATLTGTVVTVALQSSSASSVLTAAFADSGIISLYTAFWLIVGANVGTTFTGLLTALPFSEVVPGFCIIGVVLIIVSKKRKMTSLGLLFTGFGLLFVGMKLMGDGASVIKHIPFVASLLSACDSPLSGIITGCLVTAVIQSSSAFTALLQTLAGEGIIGINHIFYLLLGSNIGTCATCAVSSMGLKSAAKKVSLMHIFYNLAGSVLFLIISVFVPVPEIIAAYCGGSVKVQTAVMNIVFNSLTAILVLLLPKKKRTTDFNIRKLTVNY